MLYLKSCLEKGCARALCGGLCGVLCAPWWGCAGGLCANLGGSLAQSHNASKCIVFIWFCKKNISLCVWHTESGSPYGRWPVNGASGFPGLCSAPLCAGCRHRACHLHHSQIQSQLYNLPSKKHPSARMAQFMDACMHVHVCMHGCMHAWIHACVGAYMHTCVHGWVHAWIDACTNGIPVCMNAWMYAWMHAWMHTWTHPWIHARMDACMHGRMDACMHACMR